MPSMLLDNLFASIEADQRQRDALVRQGAWPKPPAHLDAEQQQTWHDIGHEAYSQGVDPHLALAAAHAEGSDSSRFRHWIGGRVVAGPLLPTGERATGVMQVLPSTAGDYDLDPTDYHENIVAGVQKLKQVAGLYPNNPAFVLASYNAGEGNVQKKGVAAAAPGYVRRGLTFMQSLLLPGTAEAATGAPITKPLRLEDLLGDTQPAPGSSPPAGTPITKPLRLEDLLGQPSAPTLTSPLPPTSPTMQTDDQERAALDTLARQTYQRPYDILEDDEKAAVNSAYDQQKTAVAGAPSAVFMPGVYEALFGSPSGGTETRRFSAVSSDDALSKAQAIKEDAGEAITGVQSVHLISTGMGTPFARSSPEQETLLSAHLDNAKRWLAAKLQPAPTAPALTPTPQAPPAAPTFPASGQLLFGLPTPQPATIFRNGKLVPNPDYWPLLPREGDVAPPYGPQFVEGIRQATAAALQHLGQIPSALMAMNPLLPSELKPDFETAEQRRQTGPNPWTAAMDTLSQQIAVDPKILLQHDTFADHLVRALGSAGIALPEALVATMVGGPVAGLTGLGVLSGLKGGDAAALTEAARMAILGKLLTYARTMPMALRVPFTSVLFGGTAASTGASLEDSFIQALIGAGLAIPGGTPGRGVMTQIRGLGDWWRGGGAPPEAPVPPEGAPPTAPSGGGISRTMLLRGFELEQQGATLPDIAQALTAEFGVPANAAYAGAKQIRRTYTAALQSLSQQPPANTNESPPPPVPDIRPGAPNPLPDFPRYPNGEGRLGTAKVGAEALHPAEAEDILARHDSTAQHYREAATAATDPVQQRQLTLAADHYTEAARPYREALEQWAQRHPDEAAFLRHREGARQAQEDIPPLYREQAEARLRNAEQQFTHLEEQFAAETDPHMRAVYQEIAQKMWQDIEALRGYIAEAPSAPPPEPSPATGTAPLGATVAHPQGTTAGPRTTPPPTAGTPPPVLPTAAPPTISPSPTSPSALTPTAGEPPTVAGWPFAIASREANAVLTLPYDGEELPPRFAWNEAQQFRQAADRERQRGNEEGALRYERSAQEREQAFETWAQTDPELARFVRGEPYEAPGQPPPLLPGDVVPNAGGLYKTKQNADFALEHGKQADAETHEVVEMPGGGWMIRQKATPPPTPSAEKVPPAVSTPPPPTPAWVQDDINQRMATAERLGIVAEIERSSAEGDTAGPLARKLKAAGKVPDTMPLAEVIEIVRGVRAKLGIPSQEEVADFAAWRQQYFARQQPIPAGPPTHATPFAPSVQFTTALGSTYAVDAAGRTTRTKSLHPGHLPTDIGEQAPSAQTVYVDPATAEQIGRHGMLNREAAPELQIEGDKLVLLSRYGMKDGEPYGNVRRQEVVFSRTPTVGLSPIEIWTPQRWHAGNPITAITPFTSATVPPTITGFQPGVSPVEPSREVGVTQPYAPFPSMPGMGGVGVPITHRSELVSAPLFGGSAPTSLTLYDIRFDPGVSTVKSASAFRGEHLTLLEPAATPVTPPTLPSVTPVVTPHPDRIHVSFPTKPTVAARNRLRDAGFKWNKAGTRWEAPYTDTRAGIARALAITHGGQDNVAALVAPPTLPTPTTPPTLLPSPTLPAEAQTAEVPAEHFLALVDRLADILRNHPDWIPSNVRALQQIAAEVYGGTRGEGAFSTQEMFDALETALHVYAGGPAGAGTWFNPQVNLATAVHRAEVLHNLASQTPTHGVRTTEQEALQQFSTPIDYAFAAAWVANLGATDVVLEPSAGTGALATFAANAVGHDHIFVNEIAPRREAALAHLGFTHLFHEDAFHLYNLLAPRLITPPTVVVMNPPFSQAARQNRKNQMVGARHVEEALKLLATGGRLVAIVGGNMTPSEGSAYREWFARMERQHTIRANVGVSGRVYQKQGTTYATRVLVIDKGTPTAAGSILTGEVETIPDLLRLLEGVRDVRTTTASPPGGPGRTDVAPGGPGPSGALGEPAGATHGVGLAAGEEPAVPDTGHPATGGVGTDGGVVPSGGPPISPAPVGTGRPGGRRRPARGGSRQPTPAGGSATAPGTAPQPASCQPPGEVPATPLPAIYPAAGGQSTSANAVAGLTDADIDALIAEASSGTAAPPAQPQTAPAQAPTVPVPPAATTAPSSSGTQATPEQLAQLRAILKGSGVEESRAPYERWVEGVDPAKYHLMEPLFRDILQQSINAGESVAQFVRALVVELGPGVAPYLKQFRTNLAQETGQPDRPTPQDVVVPEDSATPDANEADLTDAVFGPYIVTDLRMPGAHPHPTPLVQSAAMASVSPPPLTYAPQLAPEMIHEGRLSLPQLEAIAYAGQAHTAMLHGQTVEKSLPVVAPSRVKVKQPDGTFVPWAQPAGASVGIDPGAEVQMPDGSLWTVRTVQVLPRSGPMLSLTRFQDTSLRRGFYLGDGTGVGKGRIIAGIIADNIAQGRTKAVWISKNPDLINDSQDYWQAVTGRDRAEVFPLPSITTPIARESGILFVTYDTLWRASGDDPAQTRLSQILAWLGKDFDGALIYDESHLMGNNLDTQGGRGRQLASKRATASLDLARLVPGARVVYSSATGATEVKNLGYLERLGLWGPKTAFATKEDFLNEIESGGVATMELVARDMKALGLYTSRSLSYHGVEYDRVEVPLTDEQHAAYNKMATGWQVVLNNINQALELTDGQRSAQRSAVLAAFYNAQLAFFNQVLTAMMTPQLIARVDADLARGDAVVIQIVNTNEATQKRQLAAMTEETALEDVSLTPLDLLTSMVEKSFPIHQQEEYVDDDGNIRFRPLLQDARDDQGNPILDPDGTPKKIPVVNQEALALRTKLLNEIVAMANDIPEGPLEILFRHFDHDAVAEVTGRNERLVYQEDAEGVRRRIRQRRTRAMRMQDTDDFMDDKKQVLIFSDAGGTGRSYHADMGSKNQRQRHHYILQAGWRADMAIQGLGRTHRTNEASAPVWHLMTTDLPGHRRFISTIARRLDQLGALTRGQRQASTQGLFTERDNLESDVARDAIIRYVRDIHMGNHTAVDLRTFTEQTGLRLEDKDGKFIGGETVTIQRFLNRMLAMHIEVQREVFNDFAQRLDQSIELALQQGTLNVGMETIRADKIHKTEDRSIATEPESGAETRYVQLELSTRRTPLSWANLPHRIQVLQRGSLFGELRGYAQNIQSGRLYAILTALPRSDPQTGHMTAMVRRIGVDGEDLAAADTISKERYTPHMEADARPLWEAERTALPEYRHHTEHLLTGVLLPHWQKIKLAESRIYRLQTDDGERLLGRVLPPSKVARILENFGVMLTGEKTALTLTTDQAISRVLNDRYTLRLANEWELRPSFIGGERRIEIAGVSGRYLEELTNEGVLFERIQSKPHYFIPTGVHGAEVLTRILETRPIVAEAPPPKSQGTVAEERAPYAPSQRTVAEPPAPYGEPVPAIAAPVFFSQALRVLDELLPEQTTPGQIRQVLKRAAGRGVKQEELKWLGLEAWLAEQPPKLSKQAVMDWLRSNEAQVAWQVLGERRPVAWEHPTPNSWRPANVGGLAGSGYLIERLPNNRYVLMARGGTRDGFDTLAAAQARAEEYIANSRADITPTRYGREPLVLPGAEPGTYREVVLTLPAQDRVSALRPGMVARVVNRGLPHHPRWAVVDENNRSLGEYGEDRAGADRHAATINTGEVRTPAAFVDPLFTSSHWPGINNPLAHGRFDDRVDTQGRKLFFGEEFQSDWQREGRKQGFQLPPAGQARALQDANATWHRLAEERAQVRDRLDAVTALQLQLQHERQAQAPLLIVLTDREGRELLRGPAGEEGTLLRQAGQLTDQMPEKRYEQADIPAEMQARGETLWHERGALQDRLKLLAGELTDAQHAIYTIQNNAGVPPAPFVTTSEWYQLPLKFALRYAAEHGYDGIAWTTGRQQQERYTLRHVADELVFVRHPNPEPGDNIGSLYGYKDGAEVHSMDIDSEAHLAEAIGRGNATKLLAQPVQPPTMDYNGPVQRLTGEEFVYGGEWAVTLYDHTIPNWLNKYGKQWGARVETTRLASPRTMGEFPDGINVYDGNGNVLATVQTREEAEQIIRRSPGETVHFLPITDSMRHDVVTQGQQLFEPPAAYLARFANSKVVDEQGRLKAVFHGTLQGGFPQFDPTRKGSGAGQMYPGYFFAENPDVASSRYTGMEHLQTMPVLEERLTRAQQEVARLQNNLDTAQREGRALVADRFHAVRRPDGWYASDKKGTLFAAMNAGPFETEDLAAESARRLNTSHRGLTEADDIRHALTDYAAVIIGLKERLARAPRSNVRPVYLNITNPFNMQSGPQAKDVLSILNKMSRDMEEIDSEYRDPDEILELTDMQRQFEQGDIQGTVRALLSYHALDQQDYPPRTSATNRDVYTLVEEIWGHDYASQWLHEQGFDGIYHVGREDGKVWVAFSPDQILPAYSPEVTYAERPDASPGTRWLAEESLRDLAAAHTGDLSSLGGLPRPMAAPPVLGRPGAAGTRVLYRRLPSQAYLDQLRTTGRSAFVGQKAATVHDIAVLAQAVRDPRLERLFWIFTANDQVVAVDAVSSRLPSSSHAFLTPRGQGVDSQARVIATLTRRMQRMGADGYYLLHNHPSGKTNPSSQDKALTRNVAATLPGFRGHVVIDHDEYAVVNAQGETTAHTREDVGPDPFIPDPSLRQPIRQESDVVQLAQGINAGSQIIVFFRDHAGFLRSTQLVPEALFTNRQEFPNWLRGQQRSVGAQEILAYHQTPTQASLDAARGWFSGGLILDYVLPSSNTVSELPALYGRRFAEAAAVPVKPGGYRVAEEPPTLPRPDESQEERAENKAPPAPAARATTLREAMLPIALGLQQALPPMVPEMLATLGAGLAQPLVAYPLLGTLLLRSAIKLGLALTGPVTRPIGQALGAAASATTSALAPTKIGRGLGELRDIFSPTSAGLDAETEAYIIRAHQGEVALALMRAIEQTKAAARVLKKLPIAQRWEFIDRMEEGLSQASPELDDVAMMLREMLDDAAAQVQALGSGALQHLIDDYFPHIWANPRGRRRTIAALAANFGKRPLEGSKAFLRHRVLQYFREGLALGLKPVDDNPVHLVLLKLHEMHRYIAGQQIFQEMRAKGLVRFARGEARPNATEEWVRLDDAIARRYYRTQQGELAIAGNYWAHPEVAKIFNRFLSTGLRGKYATFDFVDGIFQFMNATTLALSAFHMTVETLYYAASEVARGIQDIGHLRVGEGLAKVAWGMTGLPPLFEGMVTGSRVLAAAKRGTSDPPMAAVIDLLTKGNFGFNPEIPYFQQQALNSRGFRQQRRLLGWMHTLMWPIFGYFVPRIKAAAAFHLAKDALPFLTGASEFAQRKLAAEISDRMDDRFGMLQYDNLFWNRAFLHTLQLFIRAVGWDLGLPRMALKALLEDVPGIAGGTARRVSGGAGGGRPPVLPPGGVPPTMPPEESGIHIGGNLAFLLGLTMFMVSLGGMMHLLLTGRKPEELRDFLHPGEEGHRLTMSTYLWDAQSYLLHPMDTAAGKFTPFISAAWHVLQNKDYRGAQIAPMHRLTAEDALTQHWWEALGDVLYEEGRNLIEAYEPWSLRSLHDPSFREDLGWGSLKNFFGVRKASFEIQYPELAQMRKFKYETLPAIKKRARSGR